MGPAPGAPHLFLETLGVQEVRSGGQGWRYSGGDFKWSDVEEGLVGLRGWRRSVVDFQKLQTNNLQTECS